MYHRNTQATAMTTGLDLGDKYSYFHTLDAEGNCVESGRLRTVTEELEEHFGGKHPVRVVLEVGTHSPWVSRLLGRAGHEVVVANPRHVKLISQNSRKNDRMDAELLARIGRTDPALLHPIHHRDERSQLDLAVLHSRDLLVGTRTGFINHVRGMVKSVGDRLESCSTESFHKTDLESIPEGLRPALLPMMEMIARLNEQIRAFDRKIEAMCKERYPETDLLRQVNGVGPATALTFVLVVEDPKRFRNGRAVGAYLGLRPRQSDSGERAPQLRISKEGDRHLRRLLVLSAHHILGPFGPDTDLRRWGLMLCARGGKNAKKRAVVAVARKLAALLYRLWISGARYEPLRHPERHPPRLRMVRVRAKGRFTPRAKAGNG